MSASCAVDPAHGLCVGKEGRRSIKPSPSAFTAPKRPLLWRCPPRSRWLGGRRAPGWTFKQHDQNCLCRSGPFQWGQRNSRKGCKPCAGQTMRLEAPRVQAESRRASERSWTIAKMMGSAQQ